MRNRKKILKIFLFSLAVLGAERREGFSGGHGSLGEGLWPAFSDSREGREEKVAEAELSR